MTPRLDEIKARLKAATPSKWNTEACFQILRSAAQGTHPESLLRSDADLIANAPSDLAFLIEEVERLQLLNANVRLEAEWPLVQENNKLREENERLLRNERNGAKDIVIAKLRMDMALACEGLEDLAKCGGGCEGPLGCMCKAPIARATLERLGKAKP